MFILGYFVKAVAFVIGMFLYTYMFILVARALLSWVNPDPYNQLVRAIYTITEPLLSQIRKKIPIVYGGLDFSIIITLIAIAFLQIFLVETLSHLAGILLR
ncbi:MAG: YggT family protein [Desulfobacteraceae bacterium]|nr:YggT family protein [Desulfobacteraceae bacterium]